MSAKDITRLLEEHGIKPTANRQRIVSTLAEAGFPMTMADLEDRLETIDKSGIFRTLVLFREKKLVHTIEEEDGVRYELCHSHDHEEDDDAHLHFHCLKCGRTFCMERIPLPKVELPEGFAAESATYLVKGVCPDCR